MLKKSLGFIAKNEKAFTIGFLIAALLLPLVLKTKYAFRMATVSMMYMLLVHGLIFLLGFLVKTRLDTRLSGELGHIQRLFFQPNLVFKHCLA